MGVARIHAENAREDDYELPTVARELVWLAQAALLEPRE